MSPISSERLIIRRPLAGDLDDFVGYRNHPDIIGSAATMLPMPIDDARAFIETQAGLDPAERDCWMMRAIEHRPTARVIGEVGMFLSQRGAQGDLGWIIHPEYQRSGFATEAARALMHAAFACREMHRLTASCEQGNVASWRVMERLGMRREVVFRQSRRTLSGWRDEFLYAVLRDDWRKD